MDELYAAVKSVAQTVPQAANTGWMQRLALSHGICYSPAVLDLYQKPLYLVRAAKAKYGNDIFVLGTTREELRQFWEESVNYRAIEISEEPKPKGRTIIDIDTKSHLNDREEDEEVDAPDRNDEFEITSEKENSHLNTKTYQLKFDKTYTYLVGGSLELKSQFFNIAGSGVSISGSRTATRNETLSQEYQLVERLVVPPKTKVKATIKSYAVTYEGTSITEVSAPTHAFIPVHYRTMLSRKLGGIIITTGYITASELFWGRPNFREEEEMVYFEEETKVSYLGQDVEILKQKHKID